MDMLCLLFVCNLWVPLGIYGNLWEFLPVGGYLWEGLDWLGGPVYTFYSLLLHVCRGGPVPTAASRLCSTTLCDTLTLTCHRALKVFYGGMGGRMAGATACKTQY